ncbi:MAG: glycosyltransferase family 1 protein [Nitrospinae bacterium]|nr:glycosyltransferase family 1 protein [Nitrospinota bacterium]MBI3813079.1 glycosyltransferase family 1 protein [Nitrospinota bacterium]
MENSLVIGHFLLYPLFAAAEKSGKPFVPVVLCHGVIPSRYITPADAPNLGKFANAFFWKIWSFIFDMNFKQNINNFRKKEGLAPIKRVLRDSWKSKTLNLIAVSPCLCEPKPDWGGLYKVCGFFNIPEESEKWDMPEDLAKFLRAGSEPVYITFGSMLTVALDSTFLKESAQLMADAVNLAGCRAIIQAPWDKVSGIPESPNIYRITRSPHSVMFRHCSAVVHHGGAGTTQSATMSGCPSIIVAHITDQEFWGKELNRIGIAPKVLYRRNVTPQRLAGEIKYVLAHPAMKEGAKKIGDVMRDENEVKQAVKLIEASFWRKQTPHPSSPLRGEEKGEGDF